MVRGMSPVMSAVSPPGRLVSAWAPAFRSCLTIATSPFRLATQIGSKLRGVLYVLDEPSIGLHPRDNHRLLETLQALRDLGNTVLVVEHDAETIEQADYVVDLGPLAGTHGGEVVATGPGRLDDNGKRVPMEVADGDRVLYSKYAGTEVKLDGEELLVVSSRDILAKIG